MKKKGTEECVYVTTSILFLKYRCLYTYTFVHTQNVSGRIHKKLVVEVASGRKIKWLRDRDGIVLIFYYISCIICFY